MDQRSQLVCGYLAGQRNVALDANAQISADLDLAKARIAELEAKVAELEAKVPKE
jgi:uncharacterized protein YceH (UPF0502 family)